jgi:hypothetical protein
MFELALLWHQLTDDKAGIDCPMTSLRDFISKEDWSTVLTQ